MKKTKVYSNIVLNTINSVLKIIFPLISYKYAAIVLGQEGVGTVNYGSSIINYFVLLAGLGVSTYAIREGAKIRENQDKINSFSSEVFTINMLSTIISYLILFICMLLIKDLRTMTMLLVVQSSLILFTTLSVEWIYSIYEDYGFIAIRNFILQIISLVLMFLFVKNEGDYIIFAGIQVLSSSGAFIVNYLNARKKVKIEIVLKSTLKKHLKPIIILFVNNVAVVLYVNSDTTMIGSILNMSAVGIYSVAVRIYTMFKTVISAVVTSVLPNISRYSDNSQLKQKNKVINDTLEVIAVFLVPMIVSTILVGKELIILTSSVEYVAGYTSLVILSLALIFSIVATVFTTFYLIPLKLENYALLSTVIAAIINIVLNYFLLPIFGFNAAAFTTFIAELIVTILCIIVIKRENIELFDVFSIVKLTVKEIIATIPLFLIYFFISNKFNNIIFILFLYLVLGGIIYLILNYILNVSIVRNVINGTINMIKRRTR